MITNQDNHGIRFLQLFVEYQQEIYAYILTLVPHRHDADDLFQEALVVMWRKFEQFEIGTNFRAWALQICRYLILDYRRRQARDKQVLLSDEALEALMIAMPDEDQVAERLAVLRTCMEKLDERGKRLLKLRFERNTPLCDMAKHLSVSIRQVQRRLATINGNLLRCMRRTLGHSL